MKVKKKKSSISAPETMMWQSKYKGERHRKCFQIRLYVVSVRALTLSPKEWVDMPESLIWIECIWLTLRCVSLPFPSNISHKCTQRTRLMDSFTVSPTHCVSVFAELRVQIRVRQRGRRWGASRLNVWSEKEAKEQSDCFWKWMSVSDLISLDLSHLNYISSTVI